MHLKKHLRRRKSLIGQFVFCSFVLFALFMFFVLLVLFVLLLGCVFVLFVLFMRVKSFHKKNKKVQNCPDDLIYITTKKKSSYY